MKVTVRKSELVKGLKKVAAAVGSKEQLNILSGIRLSAKHNVPAPHAIEDEEFDHLELIATDGTMQIRAYVPCKADSDGVACLPAKFLRAFGEALPEGEVTVETNENGTKAKISGGECKYTLATLDAGAFPVMEEPDVGKGGCFAMECGEFRELLRKVKYAAAKTEEGRRVLAGVNVCVTGAMIRMVATDGRRLSMVEHFFRSTVGNDKPKDVSVGTIPNKAVKELYGLLGDDGDETVGISTDGKKVRISTDGFEVVTKLYDDVYPNWTKVVPAKVAYTASVKRGAFLDELMRAKASTVASDSHMVKMTFDKGTVVFEGRADDISESKTRLAVGYEGEKAEFKINPALIEDVLTAIDDEDVTIGFDGSGKPLVFKCSISFVAVVMPWRVG